MKYRTQTLINPSQAVQDAMGDEGWQLVTVVLKPNQNSSGNIPQTFSFYFFYQRERA